MRVWSVGVVVALVGVSGPAAAVTFRGPDVRAAIEDSVDVLGTRLKLLQAQDLYDSTLMFFSSSVRGAPGDLQLQDGSTVPGGLARTQINMGIGGGRPSEFAFFVTGVVDVVQEAAGDAIDSDSYQGMFDIGIAFYGLQLTWGAQATYSLSGTDEFGNFVPANPRFRQYRNGTPPDLAYGAETFNEFGRQVFAAYHSTGIFAAFSFADMGGTDPRTGLYVRKDNQLVDARIQLQPLLQLLPDWVGLPMVGLSKLSAFKKIKTKLDELSPDEENASPYDFELGSDDLADLGIRARLITQVLPTFGIRQLELGATNIDETKAYGARAMLVDFGDGLEPSVDLFALFFLRPVNAADTSFLGFPIHVGVSYSYNSPDPTTFLPLRGAHVIGGQLVFGPPETARPVVPIVRSYDEVRKARGEESFSGFGGDDED